MSDTALQAPIPDQPTELAAPSPETAAAPAAPPLALQQGDVVRYTYTGPNGPVSRIGRVVATHEATDAHADGFASVEWLPQDALSGRIPIDQLETVKPEEL